MPQLKHNTIEDFNLRRSKLTENINLIEELIESPDDTADKQDTFTCLDQKIRDMITSQGFLIKEDGSGGLELRADESYFSAKEIRTALLDGFNLGERIYRLSSKILLKYYEIEESSSKVANLVDALRNVEPKKAIGYMDLVSGAITMGEEKNQTAVMFSFFNESLPRVIEAFRAFYEKVEGLRSDLRIYRKHKTPLNEAYFDALESVLMSTASCIEHDRSFLEEPIKLKQDTDISKISSDYLHSISRNGDNEPALNELEQKQKAIIVGLDYSSNSRQRGARITFIFADRYMNIDRRQATFTGKLDSHTKGFLEYLGQQTSTVNILPYSTYHDITRKAMRNIEKHL